MKDEKTAAVAADLGKIQQDIIDVANAMNPIWESLREIPEARNSVPVLAITTVLDMIDSICVRMNKAVVAFNENLQEGDAA